MAASKPVEAAGGGSGGGAGLSRWQLALVLGAPILLGAGALYLWGRRAARRGGGGKGANERKTPEGRASPGPCGGGQPDGPGHEEMVSVRLAAVGADHPSRSGGDKRAPPPRAAAAVGPRRCGKEGREERSKPRSRRRRTRVRGGSQAAAGALAGAASSSCAV